VAAILFPRAAVFNAPGLQLFVSTVVALIGLLAAFLLFERFRDTHALADLVLVAAFLVLLLTNLGFATVPDLLTRPPSGFATWSAAVGRLFAFLGLAVAAFSRPRQLAGQRTMWAVLGLSVGLVLAIGLATALLGAMFPAAGRDALRSPALLVLQLVSVVALAVASYGLLRRALRTDDQLLRWLGVAFILGAFSLLNYALVAPSLYSDSVSLGDLLRLAAYVCLLVGSLSEIGVYRRKAALAGQVEERERIARDLHDGLAQDLAFMAGRLRDLAAKQSGPPGSSDGRALAMLSSAAQRALDESRVAVATLARPRTPLPIALEQTAEEVAAREGGTLLVEAEGDVEVSAETKQALLRVVREAVGNAFRHGDPSTVKLRVVDDDGLLIEVKDDGRGFETGRAGGLGLESMRQRVMEIGGEAKIESTLGEGTVVSIRLPSRSLFSGYEGAPSPMVRSGGEPAAPVASQATREGLRP
jgi:signal transduction histidine kinase